MSIKIPSWKTRLSLSVNGKLIPFTEASASIKTPKERIHTVEKHNSFWNHLPHEYTLTFTTLQVLDIGPFIIGLQEADIENLSVILSARIGDQWSFKSLGMSDGTISGTELGPFNPTVVPAIEVSAEFLNWSPNPANLGGSIG